MVQNPCYKCTKRTPGCHSECKDYKEWKAEHDRLREKDRSERALQNSFNNKRRFY